MRVFDKPRSATHSNNNNNTNTGTDSNFIMITECNAKSKKHTNVNKLDDMASNSSSIDESEKCVSCV